MTRLKIMTPKGFRSFYKVAKKEGECIEIYFSDRTIKCTLDHRFDNEGQEIVASTLKIGDKLCGYEITDIKNIGKQVVYTPVMVSDGHKYLSKGLINYNCNFIGSTATLIDGKFLDKMISTDPIRSEDNYNLKIYEDPIPGVLYVMGVDSSTGVGNDYSVIQVIKVNSKDSFEQVAVYQNNKIKPYEYAQVIANLSSRYNEAFMILENNDCGKQVAEELWFNIGCANVLNTDKRGIGTRATSDTKLQACMMLKKAIETGKLVLRDNETINQLSRFEEISPNVFRGGKGKHDDLVSGLYWAIFCLNQPQIDLEGTKIVSQTAVEDEYTPPPCLFDEGSDNSDFWRSFR